MIVCVGQMYGLILYYATNLFDDYYSGIQYSRPEFLYFWFYYFFINFIWMIFPGSKSNEKHRASSTANIRAVLLVNSVSTIGKAFETLNKLKAKSNGSLKKTL